MKQPDPAEIEGFMPKEIDKSDLPFTVPADGVYRAAGTEFYLMEGAVVTHIGPDAVKENVKPLEGAVWAPISTDTEAIRGHAFTIDDFNRGLKALEDAAQHDCEARAARVRAWAELNCDLDAMDSYERTLVAVAQNSGYIFHPKDAKRLEEVVERTRRDR